MSSVENDVLTNDLIRPATYCRYVDEIYEVVSSQQQLINLREKLEEKSSLLLPTRWETTLFHS